MRPSACSRSRTLAWCKASLSLNDRDAAIYRGSLSLRREPEHPLHLTDQLLHPAHLLENFLGEAAHGFDARLQLGVFVPATLAGMTILRQASVSPTENAWNIPRVISFSHASCTLFGIIVS